MNTKTNKYTVSTTTLNGVLSWLGGLPGLLMLLCAIATWMPVGESRAAPLIAHPATSPAKLEMRTAYPSNDKSRTEVVFIESNVVDYQVLLKGLASGTEVHVLDAYGDGLAQMARTLTGRSGIDAIHLVSHGTEAAVQLGSLTLSTQNLQSRALELATIGGALKSDGDILLYGCSVAAGADGAAFVHALALATRANIAASNNATGSVDQGGDWTLETQVGKVATVMPPFRTEMFSGVLAQQTIDLSSSNPISSGSLASGNFVIGGIQFVVASDSGFTVSQTASGLVISETSATGNFSVTMTDTGANSQFKAYSISFDNQSTGGDPGFGPQMSAAFFDGATQLISTSVITGPQTTYFDSNFGSGTTYIGNSIVITDLEINGIAERAIITLNNFVVDLAATNLVAPTVTAISPTSGPSAGGTSVTITGTSLTGATAITIGGVAAASFTVNSATQITATTPAGTAGARDVVVTTPGGTGTGTGLFTYVAAPTVTAISPTAGPAAGGTSVTITGTNLTGTTSVTIGGVAATGFTVDSATQITATTPAGTVGAQDVVVTTPGGTGTGTGLFTYIAAPSVTAISPTAGPTAGGTAVTITGTNLTGATAVTIGGTAATGVTVVNATTITATAPAGTAGAKNVVVTTPGGTGTGTGLFTYAAVPTVTAISPAAGPTAGGTAVTITGTNLTGATAVTIGGAAATGVTVVNATTITATAPAGAAGAQDVVVTTPGGTGTGTSLYTYFAAPTVTAISPTSGPAAGGTSVTITGTNLTGATAVTIGGVAAASFTVNSATQITATTPAGTAGAQNVVVTTPGGAGTGVGLFTYIAAPTVTAISPTAGPTAGGTAVTITGTNLTGATAVTIGGAAATGVTVVNATTITATAPAGTAGAQNVVVTTPGGTGTGVGLFTYIAAPTVTAISPTSGPAAGGTSVTITGTSLTGATAVTIGGVAAASFTVNSATQITATTPAGTPGTQNVVVTTPGGTGTGASLYTYIAAPTVTAISPAAGATTGGTAVTITGTNLTGATSVTIGGTAATGVTVVSATTITATTPAGTVGAKNVAVTTPGGTGTGTGLFTYAVAPAVTSVSVPANGTYITGGNLDFTVSWDQAVTVTGSPRMALTIGATSVQASYLSGSGTTATVFRYTVLSGQSDSDGIALGALGLNGGTIKNAGGIDATLALNSVGSTAGVLVDAVAPTLPAANIVVNNQADPHKVVLTFSKALASGSLGSSAGWTVTANGGTPSYSVAAVALAGGNQVTLTLGAVDMANAATTITNVAANAHLKVTPPASLTDVAGNAYAAGLVTEAGAAHVLDATAPTLSAVATSAPTTSGGALAATSSEKAMGYWIAVAGGSAAPTVAQTQAGVAYGAVTVVAHGSGALPNATAGSFSITGLSASTTYDFYVVARDAAGNLSAGVATAALTTAAIVEATGPIPLQLPQPTVPGFSGTPTVLDMRSGSGPAIAACVTDVLRQTLRGDVTYVGQSATGATQILWNGQIISFYPLAASATDTRGTGIHTQSINPLDVVSSCGTLNVTPAVNSLNELGSVLNSLGLFAQINPQGVITVLVNGTYYVVRPDFLVTPGMPGAPKLVLGDDGLFRFTDSHGNTQIMRPAVLEPDALQSQIGLMGGSMQIQLDGTVLLSLGGKQYILTPDLTLGGVPSEHASKYWWQDGPRHYRIRVLSQQYSSFSQGMTLTNRD